MFFRITGLLFVFLAPASLAAEECVVLLHGLWRTDSSMNRMEKLLAEASYQVQNIEYLSTEESVDVLAGKSVEAGVQACGDAMAIHFVTHSMGGILIRQYLEHNDIDRLGRVVMLGPPNQGSEVIDRYADWPGFEWFSGPAGLQLGTGEASVPRALGPADFDLGIIAGNRTLNPILSQSLPGKDDGKVSVESTRVEGMNDHLEMPVNHVFMMRDKDVIEQVLFYLENGFFNRVGAE
ncbi:MAG: alpha/beta hydrolase [Xanthomonadales bacterium]|nr:alpha/beta hydrolase [Gammaproteobacteria bacterium]MBT8054443.1 alpha/beta hydrolase [Gammaproteobacteria bacterium]NND58457.1 alpha/beta hydrolase [Xanthomonadales bacterium]NNK50122.1 alpha/beta hydrolase [Xanthomonadales bacterium]